MAGEAGKGAADLAANVVAARSGMASTQRTIGVSNAQPLGGTTRAVLERYFDRDLSMVQLHTGPLVQRMSETLRADAFTVSNNIYLRSPSMLQRSDAGSLALIGHEVSHVLQQGKQPARRFIQRASHITIAPGSTVARDITGDEIETSQDATPQQVDVEAVADRVYKLMREELRLDRERRGG